MTGNGKHTTYKNGDDWGIVFWQIDQEDLGAENSRLQVCGDRPDKGVGGSPTTRGGAACSPPHC